MTKKKAKEKQVQAQLDRIQVILNGNEYKSPEDKIGAISACTHIAIKAIFDEKKGIADAAKD